MVVRPRSLAACLLVAGVLPPALAVAGGMVLPVRGVRTLARAGAFIAGADDADALWQNPAGLAHASGDRRRALLFDLGLVYQPVDYTGIASDGTTQPTVTNQQPTQPVPALAGSLGIGDRLVIGGGIATPYAALHRYDAAGPARYASVSTSGSAYVIVAIGAAYRVSDRLRIGATVQDMYSKLSSTVVLSGCPPQAVCAPDDRSLDMLAEIEQTDYLAPSASAGVQFDATPSVTLGLTLQAPTKVSAKGTLVAKLPSSSLFDNGRVAGDGARVSFTVPASARAGIEVRPLPALRIEAALAVELWSMHDEIVIDPDDIRIENVIGGPYAFTTMTIRRDYTNSYAPSLGVEWHGPNVMLGGGYAFESAAAPANHVSVLTVDGAKHLVALGGGYEDAGWQLGGAIGYVHVADVEVAAAEAAVLQLAPIRGAPVDVRVNAGHYATSYLVAGLRVARRW